MHYLANGYVIRSENSAKSASQASSYVLDLLGSIGRVRHALDYGCGKLRYFGRLNEIAKRLTIVDSEIQLSRVQVVHSHRTTIRDYVAAHWPRVRVMAPRDLRADQSLYDFILCTNVLTAIPHMRIRRRITRLLGDRLSSRGRCLFACQYTNSYFRTQMVDGSVTKFSDGFIKGDAHAASFYGLIKPNDLKALVVGAGMAIEEAWIHDQSGYVIAKRK